MDLCNLHVIRPLLEKYGFHFSKAMGQNFLIAGWVPEQIAAESGADKESGVLEIGPGVGCLTQQLSQVAGKVVAVELDKRLPPLLKESLAGCDNVEILSGDILKLDIPGLVREKFQGLTPIVCANLPYNITSPVLTALIEAGCFKTITVMVQREVARRICAQAGTADYSAFTVFVQYHAAARILFDVSPGCFVPQPKVYSSVIRLDMRDKPPAEVEDKELFFKIVKASFAQRRKTLVNGLLSAFGAQLDRAAILDILEQCGFDSRVRGETLDIPAFALLCNKIRERLS